MLYTLGTEFKVYDETFGQEGLTIRMNMFVTTRVDDIILFSEYIDFTQKVTLHI